MEKGIKMSQRDIERLEEGQREMMERLASIETKLGIWFSFGKWSILTLFAAVCMLFIHAFTGGFTLN